MFNPHVGCGSLSSNVMFAATKGSRPDTEGVREVDFPAASQDVSDTSFYIIVTTVIIYWDRPNSRGQGTVSDSTLQSIYLYSVPVTVITTMVSL